MGRAFLIPTSSFPAEDAAALRSLRFLPDSLAADCLGFHGFNILLQYPNVKKKMKNLSVPVPFKRPNFHHVIIRTFFFTAPKFFLFFVKALFLIVAVISTFRANPEIFRIAIPVD
jgi:hypothetical protein